MPHLYNHDTDSEAVANIIASGIYPRGEYDRSALVAECWLRLSERHNDKPIGSIVTALRIDVLRAITKYSRARGVPREELPCEVNPENGLPIEPDHVGGDDPAFQYVDDMDQLDSRIAETRLTQREDEVVSAFRNGAESSQEVAEMLDVSRASVNTSRHFALKKLRRKGEAA